MMRFHSPMQHLGTLHKNVKGAGAAYTSVHFFLVLLENIEMNMHDSTAQIITHHSKKV